MIDIDGLVSAARSDAAAWDHSGLPDSVVAEAARVGLLGPDRPTERGGRGLDQSELGAVAASLGAVCTSLRGLLTVGAMVAAAVDRWGNAKQRATWVPRLAAGEVVAGLAATEETAGTDLAAVTTEFEADGTGMRVSGQKRWVSFGSIADVLLVLGRCRAGLRAALVTTDQPGVRVDPVADQLGMRGARIAHVALDGAYVDSEQLIAPPGFGLTHVVGTALDHGRYAVAWGGVGMARACLDDAAHHALHRTGTGGSLAEHEKIRAALGRGWVEIEAARGLCERAASQRAAGDPGALTATIAAKYAAADAAAELSSRAVQVLGAAGCAPTSRAGRFFRDAKIMQIIEGSRDIAELSLGDHVLREARS